MEIHVLSIQVVIKGDPSTLLRSSRSSFFALLFLQNSIFFFGGMIIIADVVVLLLMLVVLAVILWIVIRMAPHFVAKLLCCLTIDFTVDRQFQVELII
jgi:hypothetical protein